MDVVHIDVTGSIAPQITGTIFKEKLSFIMLL
jgi:hypothetical protein